MAQFHLALRIETRLALRAKGKGFWEIQELMSGFTDDLPDIAAQAAGVAIPAELVGSDGPEAVGSLKDIWAAIVAFLKSPAGMALIQMIITLLLGFLTPAPTA